MKPPFESLMFAVAVASVILVGGLLESVRVRGAGCRLLRVLADAAGSRVSGAARVFRGAVILCGIKISDSPQKERGLQSALLAADSPGRTEVRAPFSRRRGFREIEAAKYASRASLKDGRGTS
jgi:hypothetical protein